MQEVLLKVWRRREVVNLANPLPYLYHAVRNESLPAIRRRRRGAMSDLDWAELLCRIFEVDLLRCPQCGHEMRIVAFMTQPE